MSVQELTQNLDILSLNDEKHQKVNISQRILI